MHELSVCQALLTQVGEIARNSGADAVERITIEWGPLSGIEPVLLRDAFAVMSARGAAAGSILVIKPIAIQVACTECGARSETRPNRLVCTTCGSFRTRVMAGDELRLMRVEMRLPVCLPETATRLIA